MSINQIRKTALDYFDIVIHKHAGLDFVNGIINMDETPMNIEMISTRTLSFKKRKTRSSILQEITEQDSQLCLPFCRQVILLKQ